MINRRHIRIKVLQLLYSKSTANSSISDLVKDYKKLQKLKLKFEINIWDKNIKIIESLFDEIYNSELFEKYESLDNLNFENRKQIVIDIFKKIIVKNEFLYQLYEDEELGWVDDFPLVNTLFLNYLKSYNESKKNNIKLKIFSDK